MTNEQIVTEIRNGFSVTDNMQSLYEKNLPLIGLFIKPYTAYEIYAEHSKTALWGIVERYTQERESQIIKAYFINGKSLRQISKEEGISPERVRIVKEGGLRRLRIGKARRLLLKKFDIAEVGVYRNGFNKFNEHDFTSTVEYEYIAIRRAEIQAEYERRKKEIEDMLNQSKRVCL